MAKGFLIVFQNGLYLEPDVDPVKYVQCVSWGEGSWTLVTPVQTIRVGVWF